MAENLILAENTLTTQFLDVYGVYGFVIPFEGDLSEFPLTLGDECVVVWDGAEYKVTVGDSSAIIADTMFVGNGSAFGLPGNNEPFVIAWDGTGATFIALTDTSETSHTVEIYQVVSNDIVLKDRHGNDLEGISGAAELRVPTTDGGFRSFLSGTRVSTTIDPDFSGYKDMVVTPNEGEVFKEVTILRPAELVPENIVKDKVIAGIVGVNEGSSIGDEFLSLIDGSIEECSGDFDSIRPYAFYKCTKLTTLRAPNVKIISERAFDGCKALKNVEGNSITEIGQNAFYGCSALESIDVSNVQKINGYAFGNCGALKKLDFGTSLNSQIGMNAFSTGAATDVIIRNTTMLPDATADYACLFGMSTQRLFVPRALVSTWKASNYMKKYHADQVYAIEDYPDICG